MQTELNNRLGRIEYKWIVLSVTTIGALMAAIDGNIVILALPDMMVSLHADLVQMIWVIMGYILISTVILLTLGRMADMLGRVRMYNLGFVIFTVGSVLCGFSRNAIQLILARMVQGAGGAMMVVNSAALLTEVFPPNERGGPSESTASPSRSVACWAPYWAASSSRRRAGAGSSSSICRSVLSAPYGASAPFASSLPG